MASVGIISRSLESNEFWFLKTNSALATPNVIGLDTKAAVPMAMNVVSTTTSRIKRLSMSFIRVVGSRQITRIAALDEMSLLTPCRKNVLWHRHEVS
ncbi:MAG: hypothetical protein QOK68_04915 [Nitrososphaeraceae archaeon]|nr:hypothetical protein [Nitrososphaeraceae archaeon]